ncbi:cupin domain-containing protein [Methylomicrobium lacus]|uniref:cupin domain-containing protein n=1 Tax=Methylomicrobium lacus TaxID=136992 RepID=UPI0035A9863D
MLAINNLFSGLPEQLPNELFEPILQRNGIEIERIISKGHQTPAGQWYDQDWDEWVLLLRGQATLVFQNEAEPIHLQPGDYLLIPAHCRHRVEWTDPAGKTIWLAIHWR